MHGVNDCCLSFNCRWARVTSGGGDNFLNMLVRMRDVQLKAQRIEHQSLGHHAIRVQLFEFLCATTNCHEQLTTNHRHIPVNPRRNRFCL